MKGLWAALTVSLSLGTAPALAQHDAPSHEDQSSGHGGHDDSGPGTFDAGSRDSGGTQDSGGGHDSGGSHDSGGTQDSGGGHDSDGGHDSGGGHDSDGGHDSGLSDDSGGGHDSGWRDDSGGMPSSAVDPPSSGGREQERPDSNETRSSTNREDRQEVAPPPTDAQRRHPRPGTETGGGRSDVDLAHEYDDLFDGNDSPFDLAGSSGHAPVYDRNRGRPEGSLHISVSPGSTRVYIDGNYVGTADEFAGLRVYIPAGPHEIRFALEGYRALRVPLYMVIDQILEIRHVMEPGTGETEGEPRPH